MYILCYTIRWSSIFKVLGLNLFPDVKIITNFLCPWNLSALCNWFEWQCGICNKHKNFFLQYIFYNACISQESILFLLQLGHNITRSWIKPTGRLALSLITLWIAPSIDGIHRADWIAVWLTSTIQTLFARTTVSFMKQTEKLYLNGHGVMTC